ncbi:MAG: hypothetical protein E6K91_07200 [Thaumarchaeota archaeon]|nr:MAG: hypothetical protein E6K91_07200 [Nitrososphaerota archaeon]
MAISFVDSLDSKKHLLLLYEDPEFAKLIEFRFIKNGLKNDENCIYASSEDSGLIVIKMLSYGIPLKYFQSNQLRVLQIKNREGSKEAILQSCRNDTKRIMSDLKPPYRIVTRIVPNVDTKEGICVELELERNLHKTFEEFGGSILCPYDISKIEETKREKWIEELRQNHHAEIRVSKSGQGSFSYLPTSLKSNRNRK